MRINELGKFIKLITPTDLMNQYYLGSQDAKHMLTKMILLENGTKVRMHEFI